MHILDIYEMCNLTNKKASVELPRSDASEYICTRQLRAARRARGKCDMENVMRGCLDYFCAAPCV